MEPQKHTRNKRGNKETIRLVVAGRELVVRAEEKEKNANCV